MANYVTFFARPINLIMGADVRMESQHTGLGGLIKFYNKALINPNEAIGSKQIAKITDNIAARFMNGSKKLSNVRKLPTGLYLKVLEQAEFRYKQLEARDEVRSARLKIMADMYELYFPKTSDSRSAIKSIRRTLANEMQGRSACEKKAFDIMLEDEDLLFLAYHQASKMSDTSWALDGSIEEDNPVFYCRSLEFNRFKHDILLELSRKFADSKKYGYEMVRNSLNNIPGVLCQDKCWGTATRYINNRFLSTGVFLGLLGPLVADLGRRSYSPENIWKVPSHLRRG